MEQLGTEGREWKTLTLNFLYPHSSSKELGCMVNVRLRSPSGKVGLIDTWEGRAWHILDSRDCLVVRVLDL